MFGDFQSLKSNPDEHRIQPIEASQLASETVVLPQMIFRTKAVFRLAVQCLIFSSIRVLVVVSFNVKTYTGIH